MPQTLTHCPSCGAALATAPGQPAPNRCAHCGSALRPTPMTPATPGQKDTDDAFLWLESLAQKQGARPEELAALHQTDTTTAAAGRLPPEYRGLKRPTPTPSVPVSMAVNINAIGIIIFGAVWVFMVISFAVSGMNTFFKANARYSRLTAEGVTAQGTITRLEVDDSDDSTNYYVYYQFIGSAHGDATAVDGYQSVSSSFYGRLEKGQTIDILYAASDPQVNTIQAVFGPPDMSTNAFFLMVPVLFALMGVGLMVFGFTSLMRPRRLRSRGLLTRAFIFDRWTVESSESPTQHVVAFAFKANGRKGQPQVFTHAEDNHPVYLKCQVGDTLAVRYLPEKPSVCWVETAH